MCFKNRPWECLKKIRDFSSKKINKNALVLFDILIYEHRHAVPQAQLMENPMHRPFMAGKHQNAFAFPLRIH
jgi:hypothetical protein